MNQPHHYIKSVLFEFKRYKILGDKTFEQLKSKEFQWKYNDTDNSIATIVKHLSGNMLSRWTNFLTEDGEKIERQRELEFNNPFKTKAEMLIAWENGWKCLFDALALINSSNFNNIIYIRNEAHTIYEAVNRQLAHYASHVGQIIYVGKMIRGKDWISPSIPRGESEAFNQKKFKK